MNLFDKKTEFIAATCPKCGGRLELDVNFEVAYCADCGTQSIIKNAKKKIKRTSLDKIIEFVEKQNNTRRQDAQESQRKILENKRIAAEIKEQKRKDRNIWWNKHWLKVMLFVILVFIISLIYSYLTK